jgi:hypothetical protein
MNESNIQLTFVMCLLLSSWNQHLLLEYLLQFIIDRKWFMLQFIIDRKWFMLQFMSWHLSNTDMIYASVPTHDNVHIFCFHAHKGGWGCIWIWFLHLCKVYKGQKMNESNILLRDVSLVNTSIWNLLQFIIEQKWFLLQFMSWHWSDMIYASVPTHDRQRTCNRKWFSTKY